MDPTNQISCYVNRLDQPINLVQLKSKNFFSFIIFGVRTCVPNFSVIKSAGLLYED